VLPAREQGVEWDPAAVEHVLDSTEGYPYSNNNTLEPILAAAPARQTTVGAIFK